jgi:bla regulator protein blaR1
MMKAVLEFFDVRWLQILGYTLLHSLWEAFMVVAIVILVLRFIPNKSSTARYIIASIGLMIIVSLSVGTFVFLYATTSIDTTIATTAQYSALRLGPSPVSTYVNDVRGFIDYCLPLFLMVWVFGASLFSLRILTGLIYVERLRRNSTLLQNEWSERIQKLAQQLNIDRLISLAESSAIQAPVVFGHLKPMILIPIGMCTSLSTEQLETIFLHEITHIRRKDYLVNLLQVAVEAIYFFNPFVWVISGIMKREREHCCDDAVVQLHGSVKEYAHALATLEELRLSKPGLSLSLAENKNQLLNRVKRLMEKSVKNYSGRERILPALLLVIGLICASWISTHTSKTELPSTNPDRLIVSSDTIKKRKMIKSNKKTESKSKDNSVNKQEQNDKSEHEPDLSDAEEFQLDYALQFNQGHFPVPENDFELPGTPPLFELYGMPLSMMLPPGHIQLDSPGFRFKENNWEEFSKEFEENFKGKFGDFYEKHQEDIQRMLEDVHEKVNSRFDKERQLKMEEFAERQSEWARIYADKWERKAALLSHQESLRSLKKNIKQMQESHEAQQREFERNHKEFEKGMKAFEDRNEIFQEKLKEQLIQDGYLGKGEKLKTIQWHNGKIEINGKKIKPEDEEKYNELYLKYCTGPQLRNFE